jgi:pyruvate/2-oxoglutarate/acetoin dehydrogenase E1 component
LLADVFDALDGPPLLISPDAAPIPFARELEQRWAPSEERIEAELRRLLATDPAVA